MRPMALAAALGTLAAGAQAQPAECASTLQAQAQAPGRLLIEDAGFRLLFASKPVPIRIGEHFSLDITLCPRTGAASMSIAKVDADMPAHRHGMNYRATLQPRGAGRFEAKGLMFHMPGRWRFIFDVSDDQGNARLTHEIEVE